MTYVHIHPLSFNNISWAFFRDMLGTPKGTEVVLPSLAAASLCETSFLFRCGHSAALSYVSALAASFAGRYDGRRIFALRTNAVNPFSFQIKVDENFVNFCSHEPNRVEGSHFFYSTP